MSIDKQLSRDKVGYLHEFNDFYKRRTKNISTTSIEINEEENYK